MHGILPMEKHRIEPLQTGRALISCKEFIANSRVTGEGSWDKIDSPVLEELEQLCL